MTLLKRVGVAIISFQNIINALILLPHYFIYKLSDNKNLIKKDLNAYLKHTDKSMSEFKGIILMLLNPYYLKLFYVRIGRMAFLIKWIKRPRVDFYLNSNIGGGVWLAHPYSTILNAKSIGKNFSCRQCTTIGNKIDGRNDLIPTIGDNVTVGANVCIIGDTHIGNNVIIGAGSIVTKDCPDNAVVAGNPARIIRFQ